MYCGIGGLAWLAPGLPFGGCIPRLVVSPLDLINTFFKPQELEQRLREVFEREIRLVAELFV